MLASHYIDAKSRSLVFPSLPFPSLPFPSLPFPSLPFPFYSAEHAWAHVLMSLVWCQQENQDKFLLQLNRDDGWSVMGVFDGHGMWGGKVASIVRDGMLKALKDVDGRKMNGSDPEMVHLLSGLFLDCMKLLG